MYEECNVFILILQFVHTKAIAQWPIKRKTIHLNRAAVNHQQNTCYIMFIMIHCGETLS